MRNILRALIGLTMLGLLVTVLWLPATKPAAVFVLVLLGGWQLGKLCAVLVHWVVP